MTPICGFPIFVLLLVGEPPTANADATVLTQKIDEHLAQVWKNRGLTPSAIADDATLLRRLSLDLIGRIPTATEVRLFLEDHDPDKLANSIERLASSPLHQRNMATFWRKIWLPQSQTMARLADGTDEWIASRLATRTPYPRMVQEFLVARATTAEGRGADMAPPSFNAFNENKPESLAASGARAFLGINLDCAQCHDHPFAIWTRDQFWETAAFFAKPVSGETGKPGTLAITIPNTNRSLKPKLIKGEKTLPEAWKDDEARVLLARWITDSSNPLFFENAVNRLWSHFFGLGLVEPLDNIVGEHPKDLDPLLRELAEAFRRSGGDTHFLTKAIVSSRAYRSSSRAAETKDDKAAAVNTGFFASRPIRGLSGEQLFDSLLVAGGFSLPGSDAESQDLQRLRSRFAAKFFIERSILAERSVIQSLALLNGDAFPASPKKGPCPTVCAIADGPFSGSDERREAMFLAVLGRGATAPETKILAKALQRGAAANDPKKELNDLFWILINTVEFSSNH